MTNHIYRELGVDAQKRDVKIFEQMLTPLFPKAFTVAFKDPENVKGLILHLDGAGSKPIIPYLCYKETGEIGWFKELAQDVVAMNVDDVMTLGAKPILFADYIAINTFKLPRAEVLQVLSQGFNEVLNLLKNLTSHLNFKVSPIFAGGETADIPDQVRTLDVVGAVFAKVDLNKAITCEKITEGDVIIGLRSDGKAKFENKHNSGLMCNGITLARHVLLSKEYELKYPEISEPSKRGYHGKFRLTDYLDEVEMTLAEALSSPTRIYAPIIAEILDKAWGDVKGMVHITGGGLTKILRIGANLRYVKDALPPTPPIFKVIQREGRVSWEEMFSVFNMGVGFEIIATKSVVDEVIDVVEKWGIEAQVIGHVEKSSYSSNELIIKSVYGDFYYTRIT
ncbi:MAG: phosphoribosylformylglycinamidine cyclo-ligase [Candidatus Methanomethylicota archaeon]|uniref:phosphoribosylformylglycinamidine cyclo-ligase n=2 Tax=Thermoproteota archaeon TaxID=2056631 RepID=A0A497EQF7_9CREN|nr:MAG: phosphoribosylformylglycinamidine cyclo-ligase [Candidatus Verstraetearchaeota archaeon]